MPHKILKRDWWMRSKALDLWSIPHFLFGVLMAFVGPLTGIPVSSAILLTLVIALLWEAYEQLLNIRETFMNITLDILLPIVAFTITSYLLSRYPLHPDDLLLVGGAFFIIYAYTNISGWLAYRRRRRSFTS